jgi:hypothetical protein
MSLSDREREASALLLSHGVLDGVSTVLAVATVDAARESNPILRPLLAEGVGFAFGAILLVVGAIAVAWPTIAERYDLPAWFPWTLSAIGALIAIGNLVVVL